MFSYEICKNFKNTYFGKHLQKTAEQTQKIFIERRSDALAI